MKKHSIIKLLVFGLVFIYQTIHGSQDVPIEYLPEINLGGIKVKRGSILLCSPAIQKIKFSYCDNNTNTRYEFSRNFTLADSDNKYMIKKAKMAFEHCVRLRIAGEPENAFVSAVHNEDNMLICTRSDGRKRQFDLNVRAEDFEHNLK